MGRDRQSFQASVHEGPSSVGPTAPHDLDGWPATAIIRQAVMDPDAR
jgi:hypothetical protein